MTKKSGKKSKVPNVYLKRQREVRGWSQRYVAQRVETDTFTVGRWERGTSRPSAYFRAKLCALFERDAEDLGFLDRTHEAHSSKHFVAEQSARSHLLSPVYDPAIPPLPTQMHELIGRDDLLYQLKTHLLSQRSLALSALNGLPGVGKTAIANQLAHDSDIQAHFQHGILWAGVGKHSNIIGLLSNWAALLSIASSEIARLTNPAEWGNTLRDVIGARRILIVLDDVWRIEDAFALKVGGPQCTYLLTTRFPQLAVQFAAEYATVVHELNENDSLALLTRFAPTVVTNELDTARVPVRAAAGLPLALTIMGRYLQLHEHSNQPRRIKAALEHLQNIQERLRLSHSTSAAERPPSLPAGTPFSLQAVIALSDQHLSPEVRQALRALATFAPKPNTFSEDVALVVSNVSTDVLDVLEDTGLLEVSGTNRYSLHQTIADYARLDTPDTRAEQRLVLYNRNFVQVHRKDYARLERGTTNMLTALRLAVKHKMHEPFVESVLALAPFWEARGLYDLAEAHLQHALALYPLVAHTKENIMQPSPQEADNLIMARLHLALGRIAERRGTLAVAEHHYETGIAFARQYDNREILSSLLANQGETALKRGDYTAAVHLAEEGLLLARVSGASWQLTALLRILGEAVDGLGEFQRGYQLYLEGLELARAIGDWETMCTLLQNLGAKAVKRGEYTLAEHYVQEGLNKAREMEHRQRLSALLMVMGVIAVRHGNVDQARTYYQESLDFARMIGHRVRLSNILQNMGILEGTLNHYTLSEAYFQEGLALARAVGHRWLIAETLNEWGEVCIGRGDWSKAKTLFSEALALAHTIEAQELIAHAFFGMGRIDAQEGNSIEALYKGQQALAIFKDELHERTQDVLRWIHTLPHTLPIE
ncbi:MAG: hypothetical protein NVS4B12_12640 [Ktedonobacteraceae bacterium]